ncbi:asparagine synthase (glutamine-hydrolyzing) [Roseomonas rosulenta]|uniref:asparagine synthase (glutamine-hydrolyzing) n=1 Tax=Roseomonas rosulenta TaxID=2748667 RepID=UPI0018DFBCE4|nr:asparagine synthase (glutamine-hydrolyzing) [Roseomonas rosulenta]
MCGIAGILAGAGGSGADEAVLRRMTAAIAHRGPDGSGFVREPGIALGHRRLAIVDVEGGAQPMESGDGRFVIVFNGEIYNHAALRAELEASGQGFRTRSDTEVILAAWRAWGEDSLGRLVGMFAFALWDREREVLALARDPLGEKPLHYAWLPGGGLAFGSEIAALLEVPGVTRRIDPVALDDFMALGYVPDPATIYRDIRRLPPAHVMVLRRGAPRPEPRRYWSLPREAAPAPEDPPALLRRRLADSVAARLMSDVPLGAFLSGGLDSGAVVALAAAARSTPLDTFTVGFAGAADERAAAAEVAAHVGARHRAEEGSTDYLGAARQVAGIFGEPFGDHSAVPTLAVCRLARRHVTVALSGDGGDEVFAGYRRYRFHSLVEGIRRHLPAPLRRGVIARLARAYPKLDRAPRWLRARNTLTELSLDSALGYYATVTRVAAERRRALYAPAQRAAVEGHDPGARFVALMEACDPDDALLQAQYADLHTYLPGDILAKVDRTSMAVSLEVRPPLLDPALVAWGLMLPAAWKLREGRGKHVLREAVAGDLPAAILARPKQGFADSIGAEFRRREAEVKGRLLGPAMLDSGLFEAGALARLADEHGSGRFDHSQALWQLLVTEGFLAQHGGHAVAAAEPALGAD